MALPEEKKEKKDRKEKKEQTVQQKTFTMIKIMTEMETKVGLVMDQMAQSVLTAPLLEQMTARMAELDNTRKTLQQKAKAVTDENGEIKAALLEAAILQKEVNKLLLFAKPHLQQRHIE